jgi:streptogramin lyase
MSPEGRVIYVFGRKGEASHYQAPPDTAATLSGILKRAGLDTKPLLPANPRNPPPVHQDGYFNQPTDIAWDADGNAYFSDDVSPVRTFGTVDSKTGTVTNYKQTDKEGNLIGTHGILTAPSGLVWMNAQPLNTFLSFDPQTSEFHNYARPAGTAGVGGNVAIDSKGNVWATTSEGAVRMDPKTGTHTFYKADVKGCGTYGITIDAEDQAWFAEQGCNAVGVVDRQGIVSRVKFPDKQADYFTDKDRTLTAKFLAEGVNVGSEYAPPLTKGPRRLSADPRGNYVWVADTFSNQIERIDIHTRQVKEYSMPHAWSEPYATAVDKNHMVWINMLGRDAVARFDPATETFTEIQLPTRGTETRWVAVDNSTDPPTVWLPYNRVNRIARIQFRKDPAVQARSR